MAAVADNLLWMYEGLRLADGLVAKALGVSEQAQSAKIETRLRQYITAEWEQLARQATKTAGGLIENGPGDVVRAGDVDRALAAIDRTMQQWAPKVTPRFTRDEREVYQLGRDAGLKRVLGTERKPLEYNVPKPEPVEKQKKPPKNLVAYVNASFDQVDDAALDALETHQVFWIGDFYEGKISPQIAQAAKTQITAGMGRKQAGEMMRSVTDTMLNKVSVPGGFQGTTRQYFEGLVANATTVSRATGHLRSFEKMGFNVYVVVNPGDHRTCEICQLMDGKEFRVADGLAQAASTLQAKHPSQVKKLHPWFTPGSAKKMIGKKGPAGVNQTGHLAKAGHSMPTYHYRCRCDIDVSPNGEVLPWETDIGGGPKPAKPKANPASTVPLAKQMKPKKVPKPKAPIKPPTPTPAPGKAATMAEVGPGTSQAVRATEFPWEASQLQQLPDMRLGGAHRKLYFQAPDGSRWMFKPVAEEFRAYGDEASAKLAKRLGVPTAELHVVKIDGRTGSIQKLLDDVHFDLKAGQGIQIETLRDYQVAQVQREHAFDWLIGNHDGHAGNLLAAGPRGNLVGIDKGQAFKFYDKDSIAFTYNPNQNFGEISYYNRHFKRYAEGTTREGFALTYQAKELQNFLKAVDDLPDEDFLAMIKPYSSRAAKAKQGAFERWSEQRFLNAALQRKKELRKTIEKYYDDLERMRRRALGIAEEVAEELPPSKVFTPITDKFVRDAAASDWRGKAFYVKGGDFEGMEFLTYGTNQATYIEAKLRPLGDEKLLAYVQRALGQETEQLDAHWAKIEKLAKSVNYHLGPGGDGVLPEATANLADDLAGWFLRLKGEDVMPNQLAQYNHYKKELSKLVTAEGKIKKAGLGKMISKYRVPPKQITGLEVDAPKVRKMGSFSEGSKTFLDGKIIEGAPGPAITFNGEVYELELARGVKAVYVRHGDDNLYSKQGKFRIRFDKDVKKLKAKDIKDALKQLERLGLDNELATADDLELLYLLKVTRASGLEGKAAFVPDPKKSAAFNVKKLKKAWEERRGVKLTKAQGYQPMPEAAFPDGTGNGQWLGFHIDVKRLVKEDVGVYHGLYGGVGDLEAVLKKGSKALVATEGRYRTGVMASGMSPGADQSSGGASFVFTRLRTSQNARAHIRFHPAILRDADTISYDGDYYGTVKEAFIKEHRHYGDEAAKRLAQAGFSGNETIIKNQISLEKWLDEVKVGSEGERDRVIGWFKEAGITRVGPKKKKIEDAVVLWDWTKLKK